MRRRGATVARILIGMRIGGVRIAVSMVMRGVIATMRRIAVVSECHALPRTNRTHPLNGNRQREHGDRDYAENRVTHPGRLYLR